MNKSLVKLKEALDKAWNNKYDPIVAGDICYNALKELEVKI